IFHELGHLLLKQDYLDVDDKNYLSVEDYNSDNSELNCDLFAANFLVPNAELESIHHITEELIGSLSQKYKVSREVILRKMFFLGKVTKDFFFSKIKEWKINSYKENKKHKESGGNYHYTKFAYLGKPYTTLVFEKYFEGKINNLEASEYLDIKPKAFKEMEHIFEKRRGL
ncbi:MAG: ImmA/IrrE family metallo-endopeptidase, partial [Legionellales bacterium]|nr:ImmA/IrrE family metallo-endopeptidase [Legionellales bacterium]